MIVILTGATSFLGLAVLRQLLAAGHRVEAVIRPNSNNKRKMPVHERLFIHELDMTDIAHLVPRGATADAFIHLAWDGLGSAGRQDLQIQNDNIKASLLAVKAAAALGCTRFLFSGSQAEYGIRREVLREDGVCQPISEYGKAKLAFGKQAQDLSKSLGMEYIHTRIFSVYGPGDHPWSLVNTCLQTWRQGERMGLSECTQRWNYLYIEDAARGLVALLDSGAPGIYNLAGDDTRILRSFIEDMYEACGGLGSYEYGQRQSNAEGAASLIPSIEKITEDTGWKPEVSFREGIYETLHCMQRSVV